tara:strand:+ start:315 stop:560 length:246 start_codon:yes stop_codon:yes gene_type:complete
MIRSTSGINRQKNERSIAQSLVVRIEPAKRQGKHLRAITKIWLTQMMSGRAVNTQGKPSHRTQRKTEGGVRGRKDMIEAKQ